MYLQSLLSRMCFQYFHCILFQKFRVWRRTSYIRYSVGVHWRMKWMTNVTDSNSEITAFGHFQAYPHLVQCRDQPKTTVGQMSKYFNFTQLLKFNRIYTQKCVDVKWGQGGGLNLQPLAITKLILCKWTMDLSANKSRETDFLRLHLD